MSDTFSEKLPLLRSPDPMTEDRPVPPLTPRITEIITEFHADEEALGLDRAILDLARALERAELLDAARARPTPEPATGILPGMSFGTGGNVLGSGLGLAHSHLWMCSGGCDLPIHYCVAAIPQPTPALDAALAAVPEGWGVQIIPGQPEAWEATPVRDLPNRRLERIGRGPTPAAALHALAARLRATTEPTP